MTCTQPCLRAPEDPPYTGAEKRTGQCHGAKVQEIAINRKINRDYALRAG